MIVLFWIVIGLLLVVSATGGLLFYVVPVVAIYLAWTMGRDRREIMEPYEPKTLPSPHRYPNLPDLRTVYHTDVDPF